jgi:hypothetical protein
LQFAEGQHGGEHEKDHAAKQENDDAVGQVAAGVCRNPEKGEYRVGAHGQAADQIGKEREEREDADGGPGLPASELGE